MLGIDLSVTPTPLVPDPDSASALGATSTVVWRPAERAVGDQPWVSDHDDGRPHHRQAGGSSPCGEPMSSCRARHPLRRISGDRGGEMLT
jgi:hypothetical protein